MCKKLIMNQKFFMLKTLLPGLIAAQIISTIQVYLSNSRLFHSIEAVKNAGFLTVPNGLVAGSLLELKTALAGGLFFTLSTGALLSLAGLISALIWVRFYKRKKLLVLPLVTIWTVLIIIINSRNLVPVVTAYFLFVPPLVFLTASFLLNAEVNKKKSIKFKTALFVPAFIIAALWAFQINSSLPVNIRDHILLSNPAGTMVNNFYYKYTLYPAEVMRTLDQKQIKTCRIDTKGDTALAARLKKKLQVFDYFEVNTDTAADLDLKVQENILFLGHKGIIIKTDVKDFLAAPQKSLSRFSAETDSMSIFALFTFVSILTGFPAVMIIIVYSLMAGAFNIFTIYNRSALLSISVCLAFALFLTVYYYRSTEIQADEKTIPEILESGNWHKKVMALKVADERGMDITRYKGYRELLTSDRIPVRYWTAKALGSGLTPESYGQLLKLLDDKCPNVVTMALQSLARRGDKKSTGRIISKIKTSDSWYEQRYAYRALRALGWNQTISD